MPGNKEAFFHHMHDEEFMYFGYSDLGMRTDRISTFHEDDVSIRSQVTTHYEFRNPILAAAMNCVSEEKMAIAMGLVGAGAIIHHANTPEEQAEMVKNTKNYLQGIIDQPVLAVEDDTIAETLARIEKMGRGFKTLPVIDDEGRCSGLMDKACFELFDPGTKIREAMHPVGTFPTAEAGITPDEAYDRMLDDRLSVLTLLDTERRIGGLCLVKDIARMKRSNPKEYSLDKSGKLITLASVSTRPEEALERVRLMRGYLNIVVIDTSHGDHQDNVDTLRALKDAYGNEIDIISGNLSTEETAREIAKLEPDAISVGQGPGQICISSDRLGYGTPQASAVYEAAKGARSINPNISIIADGGISDSADTVKAFALGATAVKCGGLVAGTDETPVPVEYDKETRAPFKWYWGMGSERAQRAFAAARARYGNYGPAKKIIFIEGFEKKVPLKGPVANVINEHALGVRISMAAMGYTNIVDLSNEVSFMRGNNKKS